MTSGELDFNNFSQRNSAPGITLPGSSTDQNQIRVISSLEEMRALAIALGTIAGHALKVARANPIHALRYE